MTIFEKKYNETNFAWCPGVFDLFSIGCNRSDSTKIKLPTNGWVVNGNTYNIEEASSFNGRFFASDSFSNRVTIEFGDNPNLDKDYKIVVGENSILNEDEASVSFYNGDYYGSSKSSKKLSVSLKNGRGNVTVPEIWLTKDNSSKDSLRFTAQMVETK